MHKRISYFLIFVFTGLVLSCNEDDPVTLDCTIPLSLEVSELIRPDPGEENGIVFLNGGGGSGDYIYSKDDSLYQELARFSRLKPGGYTFYVEDENGCRGELEFLLRARPFFDILYPFSGDSTGVDVKVNLDIQNYSYNEESYLQQYINQEFKGQFQTDFELLLTGLEEGWTLLKIEMIEDGQLVYSDSTRFFAVDSLQELTVINGTGSGIYNFTDVIEISADAPQPNFRFKVWSGDIQHLQDPLQSSTTVTIPNADVTVEATYEGILYQLTVNNGSGTGQYPFEKLVDVEANPPASGKQFKNWSGDIQFINSTANPVLQFRMPAQPVTLTANYEDAKFQLTVGKGTGEGSYSAGQKITIKADPAPPGQTFNAWTGDIQYLNAVNAEQTTITMPAANVTVTATYRDLSTELFSLAVTNGSGDGNYSAGTKVSISADPPAAGKEFDRWTGDVAYLDDSRQPTTLATMPEANVAVEANYKDVSVAIISYSLDVKPIFEAKCNTSGCHNGTSNYSDLTAHSNILNHLEDIRLFVQNGRMPPAGKLPDAEIKKIVDWIDQGAKNN